MERMRANLPNNTLAKSEAPRPQGGASRKGNFILIVPLDPAYKAGLAGHLPVENRRKYHAELGSASHKIIDLRDPERSSG